MENHLGQSLVRRICNDIRAGKINKPNNNIFDRQTLHIFSAHQPCNFHKSSLLLLQSPPSFNRESFQLSVIISPQTLRNLQPWQLPTYYFQDIHPKAGFPSACRLPLFSDEEVFCISGSSHSRYFHENSSSSKTVWHFVHARTRRRRNCKIPVDFQNQFFCS